MDLFIASRARSTIVLLATAVLGSAAACGEVPHDPVTARGEQLARVVCSACHVVAKDQEIPPLLAKPAPSFQSIANRPGTSADSIAHFVSSTHWDFETLPMKMPDLMMTKAEATAVARYIMSLRTP